MHPARGALDLGPRPPRMAWGWAGGTICGAQTSDPVFALTFDDGPDPVNTPVVLALLAEHGAGATFFVISELAEQHPSLISDIRNGGHEVALHGLRHIDLTSVAPWTARTTIRHGLRQLEAVAGAPVRFFRPPYGTQSPITYALARRYGLEVVGWSASPRDFLALDPQRHVDMALEDLRTGGIVLMHDGPPTNPAHRRAVLDAVLGATDARGWRAVSVGDLIDRRTPRRRPWFFRRAAGVIEEMRPLIVREDGVSRAL